MRIPGGTWQFLDTKSPGGRKKEEFDTDKVYGTRGEKVEDFIKKLDGDQTFSQSKKTSLWSAIRDFQSGTSKPCDVSEGLSEELKNLQNEKCNDL